MFFFRFEYNVLYDLYPCVTLLLTLPRHLRFPELTPSAVQSLPINILGTGCVSISFYGIRRHYSEFCRQRSHKANLDDPTRRRSRPTPPAECRRIEERSPRATLIPCCCHSTARNSQIKLDQLAFQGMCVVQVAHAD
jgi:hypothetical protein